MATQKRTELLIKEKVELLKNSDGKSSRQLAEKYGVGRTQVQKTRDIRFIRGRCKF